MGTALVPLAPTCRLNAHQRHASSNHLFHFVVLAQRWKVVWSDVECMMAGCELVKSESETIVNILRHMILDLLQT